MISQIKAIENTAIPLVPVDRSLETFPIILTGDYKDIPEERIINVKGCSTVGFWLKISGGNAVKLRVLAAFEEFPGPNDFYSLPIQLVTTSSVSMNSQIFELTVSGDFNLVFSVPIFGLIKYIKLQAKGNGLLNDARVSFVAG